MYSNGINQSSTKKGIYRVVNVLKICKHVLYIFPKFLTIFISLCYGSHKMTKVYENSSWSQLAQLYRQMWLINVTKTYKISYRKYSIENMIEKRNLLELFKFSFLFICNFKEKRHKIFYSPLFQIEINLWSSDNTSSSVLFAINSILWDLIHLFIVQF